MIFLVLSIICSAILILLFKVFERQGIPIFQAIVFNYCTAALCGYIFLPDKHMVNSGAFINAPWFALSVILGLMFITVFNLTSLTVINFGVSTASVASKLGLVFPVMLAFLLYKEDFDWIKLAGILLAFAAVVMASLKAQSSHHPGAHARLIFLPYIVFLGNGACDSVTQFANKHYLTQQGNEYFAMFIFVAAGITGLLILIWQLINGRSKINMKSVAGGIVLGIPNYFSFLFLLQALASLTWGSSVVFPISNLGTVALATITGYIVFKERISKVNFIGLLLAAASIGLIVISGRIK
jgi:drug/metabolite transporter (DMT)-like permease